MFQGIGVVTMNQYREHYDVGQADRIDRRRRAATDFLAVLACALLFGLPMIIYMWRMTP
jgi:TRAP-type C4-dicarboxylate transport system permease small subunit